MPISPAPIAPSTASVSACNPTSASGLKYAVQRICVDANRSDWPPEQLLVAFKTALYALPAVQRLTRGPDRDEFVAHLRTARHQKFNEVAADESARSGDEYRAAGPRCVRIGAHVNCGPYPARACRCPRGRRLFRARERYVPRDVESAPLRASVPPDRAGLGALRRREGDRLRRQSHRCRPAAQRTRLSRPRRNPSCAGVSP